MRSNVVRLPKQSRTPLYDEMCRAIEAARRVDEVAKIIDQTTQIKLYEHQARNIDNEQWVCEIRLRAERQLGRLLAERDRAKPGPRPAKDVQQGVAHPLTLSEMGIGQTRASRAEQLAGVPDAVFEEAVTRRGATIRSIIREHAAEKPIEPAREEIRRIDPMMLWLDSRLKDFDRDGILGADPDALMETAPERIQDKVCAAIPDVIAWLQRVRRVPMKSRG